MVLQGEVQEMIHAGRGGTGPKNWGEVFQIKGIAWFRMENTCIPMMDLCQCMAKPI